MTYVLIWLAVAYVSAVLTAGGAVHSADKRHSVGSATLVVLVVTALWPVHAGNWLRTQMLRARDAIVAKWKARRFKA